MARVFLAQGLTTNGVAVGGMASIAFDAGYRDVVKSSPDGAQGEEEVDRSGLSVGVTLDCGDVTKSNAGLDGADAEHGWIHTHRSCRLHDLRRPRARWTVRRRQHHDQQSDDDDIRGARPRRGDNVLLRGDGIQ